jgi:tRNA(Ile2) C34 agmatinyltransferase TiaS
MKKLDRLYREAMVAQVLARMTGADPGCPKCGRQMKLEGHWIAYYFCPYCGHSDGRGK